MIPTRIHALIDWSAVVAIEWLGRRPVFSRRVGRLLRGAARAHAGYSALTDYELGLGPLPVRAHLAIDASIGAGLIASGLLLRDEPRPVRALLLGMGTGELLLDALTDRERGSRR